MRVIVVGAGIIGLAIGWRVSQSGAETIVVDPDPAGGSSFAAAGMLAPISEAGFAEAALLRLNNLSLSMWPSFAAEVSTASGHDVGLRREGTLLVAADRDDLSALRDLYDFQRDLGLPIDLLNSRECRTAEPALSPRVCGGVAVPGEASVDPRAVCRALRRATERCGGRICGHAVDEVLVSGGRVTGVRLGDGTTLGADRVVVAAGPRSGRLPGLPEGVLPPVRPVKGQIVRLRGEQSPPILTGTVRALVRGIAVYLVPRADGEIVVGATVEEVGFDTTVTARGLNDLLSAAIEVVPELGELTVTETVARLRPGTPDNGPVIGTTTIDGLLVATGHYRNGVLLAPITAASIADMLNGGPPVPEVAAFGCGRFGA